MPPIDSAKIEGPYQPYLCMDAVAFLESLVRGARVLEYGGGASTPWLSERASSVFTVEHDPEWAAWICKECLGASNVLVILQRDLERYPSEVENREMFDVVIVDGHDKTRVECVRCALPYIVPGGWLVLDDSHWAKLRSAVQSVPNEWKETRVRGKKRSRTGSKVIATETTFWRRPCE